MKEQFYIKKAAIQDVSEIHSLLLKYSKYGGILPRSYSELYSHLRDFFVLVRRKDLKVRGCCALTITWSNLAEIRSLVVDESCRGMGWGKRLVDTCLSEALTLGIYKVFVLTTVPEFFRKLGFKEINRDLLPQKVWSDCMKCPKFPDACDEIPMIMEL